MENVENNERDFDLGTILSITSGRLLVDLGDIYDILSYVTDTQIQAQNISSAMRVAEFCILQRYPQLRNIGKDVPIRSQIETVVFINSQKQIFGESLPLSPISINRESNIITIDEVYKRTGRK